MIFTNKVIFNLTLSLSLLIVSIIKLKANQVKKDIKGEHYNDIN